MKCTWIDVPGSERDGKRLVVCARAGCPHGKNGSHRLKATANPHDRINATCNGWPMAHEWREWLALFSAAAGITQAMAVAQYVRWRAGGSNIQNLPPGIPRPNISPPTFTPEEVKELFGDLPADQTLIGNRIAALTKAIGIPHCGGCESRRQWLNKAHEWLRTPTAAPDS